MRRQRKEPGQRIHGNKWEVFVRVNGVLRSKRFDLDTPVEVRRKWRDDQTIDAIPAPDAGSFAALVAEYLAKPAVKRRRHVQQVAKHLQLWIDALGGQRSPSSITRDDVEGVLQDWLERYAQPTVYHRRTSLRSLFVTMRGNPGPLDGTTVPDHERPIDRSLPFATAQRIVDAMRDTKYDSPGIASPSGAKLAARIMLHTGIPHAELQKLGRAHFDRVAKTIRMPWRDKGDGTPGHMRELSDDAVAAFVALDGANLWGNLPPGTRCSASFKRAARAVLGADTPVRFYDLRHALGTDLYRLTKDIETVGRLLGHAAGSKVTARYAIGAHADVDRAAVDAVAAWRAQQVAAAAVASTPNSTPVRRRRKPSVRLIRARA